MLAAALRALILIVGVVLAFVGLQLLVSAFFYVMDRLSESSVAQFAFWFACLFIPLTLAICFFCEKEQWPLQPQSHEPVCPYIVAKKFFEEQKKPK